MENPHEQIQNALLARIINNVVRIRNSWTTEICIYSKRYWIDTIKSMDVKQEKLNESVIDLNKTLEVINRENMDVELLSQMWENYQRNILFQLEKTGQLQPPLWLDWFRVRVYRM